MKMLDKTWSKDVFEVSQLAEVASRGGECHTDGLVHVVRELGDVVFIVLRKRGGVLQCVVDRSTGVDLTGVKEGSALDVWGTLVEEPRAKGGYELHVSRLAVLSTPAAPMPIILNKGRLKSSLDVNLALRPIALRNLYERAKFRLQEGLVRGFRDYLTSQGFTEIHSPKIVAEGAEGGANIFEVDYFDKPAYLAQSPQFYKQMLVPVFERVYEVGPVFRAEKHNTARHLNEYTGMDFEMGFIDSFEDVMVMEANMLTYTMDLLRREYADELEMLQVDLPSTDKFATVRFAEAKKMVEEKYGRHFKNPYDLEPEEEQLLGKLFLEEHGADFVFVTHYPVKKRPFYAMDDPSNPTVTLSFDLMMRGVEVTTGGQRIHDYAMQVEKMRSKGMDPANFESYLMIHKHGMPPHGGLGIGLERLLMKLLDLQNVREASLFPRDMTRLRP